MFMKPLRLDKPESIANDEKEIQIVDTRKMLKTHAHIGFTYLPAQLNRTLLRFHIAKAIYFFQ